MRRRDIPRTARLAALLGATLLASLGACAKPRLLPGAELVTGIDFSDYSRRGFLFTPGMYTEGPYESLGLVTVTVTPQARQVPDSTTGYFRWQIERITADDIVRKTYDQAIAMGADALVNFEARVREERLDEYSSRPILEVSGFAIRRGRSASVPPVVRPDANVNPPANP